MRNALSFLVFFTITTVIWVAAAHSQRLIFMTGPAGGTWYPLGGANKKLTD